MTFKDIMSKPIYDRIVNELDKAFGKDVLPLPGYLSDSELTLIAYYNKGTDLYRYSYPDEDPICRSFIKRVHGVCRRFQVVHNHTPSNREYAYELNLDTFEPRIYNINFIQLKKSLNNIKNSNKQQGTCMGYLTYEFKRKKKTLRGVRSQSSRGCAKRNKHTIYI